MPRHKGFCRVMKCGALRGVGVDRCGHVEWQGVIDDVDMI